MEKLSLETNEIKGRGKDYAETIYKRDYRTTETVIEREYSHKLTPLENEVWQTID